MEPSLVRSLFATLFCLFIFTQSQATNPNFNTEEIRDRVQSMELIVKPRYTSSVEGYIKKYISYDGGLAKRVMGRSAIYFPIFDKYLKEHDMPQDLKYLAIVESALIPKAVSPVGAGGLWQFMAETGRGYGLTINREVDERSCAHNSTQAAMKYLQRQFERYGSWELALAAYNCGAGNINRAIKRARSDNYWTISNYLPRETRNFVPAFIGAAYVANYYHLHNIEPEFPHLDLQLTEAIPVFDKIDFETIAAVSGVPVELVAELNQAFKKQYVPESTQGYNVVLPKRAAPGLKEYLGLLKPDNGVAQEIPELPAPPDTSEYFPETYYFRSIYTVAEGDNLDDLAAIFNCSPYNLKIWNNLTSNHIAKGQDLQVWFPHELHHFLAPPEKIEIAPEEEKTAPVKPIKNLAPPKKIPVLATGVTLESQQQSAMPAPVVDEKQAQGFKVYQLQRNETIYDAAQKFKGVTVKDLMEWNGFTKENLPAPGAKLIVKAK
jgi:membrane-bound lytic murein transglycosylase D